jgi:DNA-binding NarL/FixJ family response regulator
MAAAEDADVDSSAFLERMTSIVVRRGQLSPAVARIVPDILLGRDYAAIAANHGVSVETIRTHVKTLLARLSLSSAKAIWQVCVAELDG